MLTVRSTDPNNSDELQAGHMEPQLAYAKIAALESEVLQLKGELDECTEGPLGLNLHSGKLSCCFAPARHVHTHAMTQPQNMPQRRSLAQPMRLPVREKLLQNMPLPVLDWIPT